MQTIEIKVPDGYEIQLVRKKENKELVVKTYQDLINNNERNYKYNCNGYYINDDSEILALSRYTIIDLTDRNIAASEKVAKSMLAMAMISQLMPYYGGEITNEEWKTPSISKYCISRYNGGISLDVWCTAYSYLAFHTAKQRDEFLKYNEQLVKDYLMI